MLVAVHLTSYLHLYLILSGGALQIPPVIPMRQDLSRAPGKCPAMLEELDVYLGLVLLFSLEKPQTQRAILVRHYASLGEGDVVRVKLLLLSF